MSDLSGQHFLLVGATGGLGSAISRELAAAGAELTVSGRDADKLENALYSCAVYSTVLEIDEDKVVVSTARDYVVAKTSVLFGVTKTLR